MTTLTHVTKKSNVRRACELFMSFTILLSTTAFKRGDVIELKTELNGRATKNFITPSNIKIRRLPIGTVGRVLKIQPFRSTGNQGVQIVLEGSRYQGLPESQRTVWVYNWANRSNDLKQCRDRSCNKEVNSMDAAPYAQTATPQPAAQTAQDVQTVSENPNTPVTVIADPNVFIAGPVQATVAPIANPDVFMAGPVVIPEATAPQSQMLDAAVEQIDSRAGSGGNRTYSCGRNAGARTCMVCNCYFESRGEPLRGKVAVSLAVLARTNSGRYPTNACGVIYQTSQFSWTPANGNSTIRPTSSTRESVGECEASVDYALQNPEVQGPMNFHATYVNPRWRLARAETIGNHVFYSTPGFPRNFTVPVPRNIAEIQRTGNAQ